MYTMIYILLSVKQLLTVEFDSAISKTITGIEGGRGVYVVGVGRGGGGVACGVWGGLCYSYYTLGVVCVYILLAFIEVLAGVNLI